MGISSLACIAQGWTAGMEGFSPAHVNAIIVTELVNVVWMIWLLVSASRRGPM